MFLTIHPSTLLLIPSLPLNTKKQKQKKKTKTPQALSTNIPIEYAYWLYHY